MTENKRFQYNVNKNCIEYDGNFVAYVNSIDGFRIANKLTALAKENEQLKTKNNAYIQDIEVFKEENTHLKLKNEQLQERNNRQCKQLDNLYNLIEKQDWKTLTGLIQEFKECEEQLRKEWSDYE